MARWAARSGTNIVKAFIVLTRISAALEAQLQAHVRTTRLTYPKEIEFIDALPHDHPARCSGACCACGALMAAKP
jgi:acyl-coenzyme A synthetase/AMP-(fatty) acid ligase